MGKLKVTANVSMPVTLEVTMMVDIEIDEEDREEHDVIRGLAVAKALETYDAQLLLTEESLAAGYDIAQYSNHEKIQQGNVFHGVLNEATCDSFDIEVPDDGT